MQCAIIFILHVGMYERPRHKTHWVHRQNKASTLPILSLKFTTLLICECLV